MMIDLTGFTPDEQAQLLKIIELAKLDVINNRINAEAEARLDKNKAHLLRLAADYKDWLRVNRRGSTFSTFVDEFGYDSMLAKKAFWAVDVLLSKIDNMGITHDELFFDVDYPKPPYAMETDDD